MTIAGLKCLCIYGSGKVYGSARNAYTSLVLIGVIHQRISHRKRKDTIALQRLNLCASAN